MVEGRFWYDDITHTPKYFDGTVAKDVGSGTGVSTFTELTDVPNSMIGQAGLIPTVNETETALEYLPASGGVGSPSIYLSLDADTISASDFTNNVITGAFEEDTTETDNIRYKLTNAVGASGSAEYSQTLFSDAKSRRTHICKIYNSEYDGTKGAVTLVITDQADNVLETIEIDPSVSYQKKIFTLPDTVTAIKVKPTIVSDEASSWVFDKVVLDYHVLGESNLEIREQVLGAGNNGASMTANVTDINFTEVSDESNAWDGTTYTVPYDGVISITGNAAFTAAAIPLHLFKDGVFYKNIGYGSGNEASFAIKEKFAYGDMLSLRSGTARTLNNSTTYHHI